MHRRSFWHAPFVRLAALLLAAVAAGAGSASAAQAASSGFSDVTEAVGLAYRLKSPAAKQESEENPNWEDGGLTLADIDGDGNYELYVAHGAGETGRLFSWDGGRFVRVARNRGIEPASMDRAGYFIDLDHDGRPDFISIQSRSVEMFRNQGAGQFVEATGSFGIRHNRITYSMAAADYDGDGDLDLFFAHWNNVWNGLRPPSHYLWRNDGEGRYEDVSHIVPIRPTRPPIPDSRGNSPSRRPSRTSTVTATRTSCWRATTVPARSCATKPAPPSRMRAAPPSRTNTAWAPRPGTTTVMAIWTGS